MKPHVHREREPSPGDELLDPLRRARELDPGCDEGRLSGYFDEIAEAAAVLENVEVTGSPCAVSFDPSWPDEQRR